MGCGPSAFAPPENTWRARFPEALIGSGLALSASRGATLNTMENLRQSAQHPSRRPRSAPGSSAQLSSRVCVIKDGVMLHQRRQISGRGNPGLGMCVSWGLRDLGCARGLAGPAGRHHGFHTRSRTCFLPHVTLEVSFRRHVVTVLVKLWLSNCSLYCKLGQSEPSPSRLPLYSSPTW